MSDVKKILIADHDKFLASALNSKLSADGFDVKVVYDGSEVKGVVVNETPDLLILSLILPKKDGFEVLSDIRSDPDTKDLPIVVSSNLNQPEDDEKAKSLGANDYIVKSGLSLDELMSKIHYHLE